jgi:NAD(P)-dependent dehydrogenase (short-subunit alcohol dehydrogenase family)
VAAEIRAAGGQAVASTDSVASEEGAKAIVQTALDAFGSIDIVVNNAGLQIAGPFDVVSPRDFERQIQVNFMGPYYMCRAAWPHMKARGYGRIVNITSSSMTGYGGQSAYGASKGGLWSLTRMLAVEGIPDGIKVNAVSPGGYTRMVTAMLEEASPLLQHAKANMPPELSSPAVAFLAHEACPVTGECIDSSGGEIWRSYMARTPGIVDRDHTIETIAERWDEITGGLRDGELPLATMDTSEWLIKPYTGEKV